MEKYAIYIRYTIETKVTVEADSEIGAMELAEKECSIDAITHNPEGSKIVENQHKTIYRTEKVGK